MKKKGHNLLTALFILGLILSLMACSGGGGGGAGDGGANGGTNDGTNGGTNGGTGGGTLPQGTSTAVVNDGTTIVNYQPGGAILASLRTAGSTTTLTFKFPANAASRAGVITLSLISQSNLPVGLHSSKMRFQANSANVYFIAFSISTEGTITSFDVPIQLSGNVSPTVPEGTTLNLASLQTGTWVDIGTVTVGPGGTLIQNLPSLALPSIQAPGTFLMYQPAPATSTAVSNLGIALIANDGVSSTGTLTNSLQVVHLFDVNGIPLATPVITYLLYPSAIDLDGQALTPDGSQGIMVGGDNNLWFFSNVQTGAPIASTAPLDVSAYGTDGDSVAIMPNGDEAVVSLDTPTSLLVVSGIVSGNPQSAMTITIPDRRDGVVISNDGRVLLARGLTGLTVFSITSIASTTGPLGGIVSNSYTQTADLTSLVTTSIEDGRDGIAISPNDSGRAVLIGKDAATSSTAIQLITGLPDAPSVSSPVGIAGATTSYAVSITPDGTTAIVGTNAGLAILTGVNAGTLTQVGALFAPTYVGTRGTTTVGVVTTLGITLDGNYVVICDDSNASLLVIPIIGANGTGATGLGAPVGVLTGIAVPFNDQMVIH